MDPERSRARHLIDASIALCALVVAAPILLVAAAGIALSSPGPILYRAPRIARERRRRVVPGGPPEGAADRRRAAGYHGHEFTIYKLRTMHLHDTSATSPITARNDARVFPFGALLRATKIDELPQLLNVIRGDMALVGPRPEAPEIVRSHYSRDDLTTLHVLPGLTSPGSLFYYTSCEDVLPDANATGFYAERVLPVKLAIDRVYIGKASLAYDLRILLRTVAVIAARLIGKQRFLEPPEISQIVQPPVPDAATGRDETRNVP